MAVRRDVPGGLCQSAAERQPRRWSAVDRRVHQCRGALRAAGQQTHAARARQLPAILRARATATAKRASDRVFRKIWLRWTRGGRRTEATAAVWTRRRDETARWPNGAVLFPSESAEHLHA